MNPVKNFLQNIVSGKFNNSEEARKFYLDVYGDEQKYKGQTIKQTVIKT